MKRRVVVLAAAALLVTGCLPQPATTEGDAINSLYWLAMAMAAVVAVIVWGLLTFVIVRYRRGRRPATDLPKQTRGSNLLEVIWFSGPLLAVLILFVAMLFTLNTINAADPPTGSVNVHVTAFRWGWTFDYTDEGVSVTGLLEPGPEAVLPINRPIHITLTSTDVVHSFFVPQFLYKRDAIPGHPNYFTLNIEQAGSYTGQCAEFCGLYHSQMPFVIRAVSEPEYEAWLAQQRASGSSPGATGSPGVSP